MAGRVVRKISIGSPGAAVVITSTARPGTGGRCRGRATCASANQLAIMRMAENQATKVNRKKSGRLAIRPGAYHQDRKYATASRPREMSSHAASRCHGLMAGETVQC